MTEPGDKDLIESAARLRERGEDALGELTIARLRAARRNALEATPRPLWSWRLTGGLAAAGAALGLAGVLWLQAPSGLPPSPTNETAVADMELLTTENPEFYTDLEFYLWLADAS